MPLTCLGLTWGERRVPLFNLKENPGFHSLINIQPRMLAYFCHFSAANLQVINLIVWMNFSPQSYSNKIIIRCNYLQRLVCNHYRMELNFHIIRKFRKKGVLPPLTNYSFACLFAQNYSLKTVFPPKSNGAAHRLFFSQ